MIQINQDQEDQNVPENRDRKFNQKYRKQIFFHEYRKGQENRDD